MNTKLRQKVRKPNKKEIGGAFVTLVLAALIAAHGGYQLDLGLNDNSTQPVNNTDNATSLNQSENVTDVNQFGSNQTEAVPDNLNESMSGNKSNTS